MYSLGYGIAVRKKAANIRDELNFGSFRITGAGFLKVLCNKYPLLSISFTGERVLAALKIKWWSIKLGVASVAKNPSL